jgi:hypothetical protein
VDPATHLQNELLLRREIFTALSDAVENMERWTAGVSRYDSCRVLQRSLDYGVLEHASCKQHNPIVQYEC